MPTFGPTPPADAELVKKLETLKNIKYDADKVRMDLLPLDAIQEVAKVYGMGAKKYAAEAWRPGMSWKRIFAAMLRHLTAWSLGQDTDPESGLNHMAHVAWGCLTLLNYSKTHPELDDRVKNEATCPRA